MLKQLNIFSLLLIFATSSIAMEQDNNENNQLSLYNRSHFDLLADEITLFIFEKLIDDKESDDAEVFEELKKCRLISKRCSVLIIGSEKINKKYKLKIHFPYEKPWEFSQ